MMESDYSAVTEEFIPLDGLMMWKYTLVNGTVLSGEVPFGPELTEDAVKELCRADAQNVLEKHLGLDSTTLVHPTDPIRIEQIAQFEKDMGELQGRIHNLKQSILTGVYLEAEQLSIKEQIQQAEMYATVLTRKINRMKL